MKHVLYLAAVTAVAIASVAHGEVVLSENLVVNGDFESTANLKNDTSPDGVLPHRFSQEYDLGMWVGYWGPPNNPGGLGGFSTYDDPRDVGETGGNTRNTGNLGNMNRSVDPTNSGNHLMEVVMFRPSFAQWIAAPENHVPGPMTFSFDFINTNGHFGNESWGRVFVYGMNVLPPHDVSILNGTVPGAPQAVSPADPNKTGAERFQPVTGDGDLLFRYGYNDPTLLNITPIGDDPPFEYLNNWHHINTDLYGGLVPHPDDPERNIPVYAESGDPYYAFFSGHMVIHELTQTYDYYAVVVQPFVYSETDPYWWLYSPDARITDNFVIGFDNFNLQLAVDTGAVIPDPVPADFSIDALVNTEDINPFILALTNTTAWLNYARPLLPDGLTDQQIIDYADPNGDGSINTEDIAWFICWLTTPGSCGGGGAIIPEPASLGLLGLGALALLRRRR